MFAAKTLEFIFNSLGLIGINWKIDQNLKIKLKKAGLTLVQYGQNGNDFDEITFKKKVRVKESSPSNDSKSKPHSWN